MLCLAGGLFLAASASRGADASDEPLADLKKLSLEQLMDIEVTSVSRHPERLLDAPSAIQVITGEDIRRSGASSLPEALRLADNLDVAQKNAHDWGITARGFNTDLANKLLVMIDGRTVYTPLFSGVFWDVQNRILTDIDRIEVISGPGGTLWGANAVNGVINITSKDARDTQGGLVETMVGTELEDAVNLRYGGVLAPGVFYRVYGQYFERDDAVLPNGTPAGDGWRMRRGGFRIDAEPTMENTLTLQGDVYGGTEGIETGGEADVGGGNLLARWSHPFSAEADLRLQIYYDRTHLDDPIPRSAFAGAGILTDDLDTYDVDFQNRFPAGRRQEIVWGLGYRYTHDSLVNAPGLAFVPAQLDRRLYSGFLQDKLTLRENLTLTLGSKIEHNDYTGRELEPSARLQWNIAPTQLFWSAVSRAVRTPSRVDRDIRQPSPPPAVLFGGTDFDSETVTAYEAGYRADLAARVSGSLTVFYNSYNDLRSLGVTPVTILPLVFQNNLEGETHGLELSLTYQPLPSWRLHGGYDLLEEHLHVKPGQLDLNHALNETSDPEQQFSLRSSLDLPHGLEWDATLRWVDELHDNNNGVVGIVPSYFELDARLGWRFSPALEFSVVGNNLLHSHHPEFGVPSPTREEIQRSVYGKVSWQF